MNNEIVTNEIYREFIEEKNTLAKDYYKDAYNFTKRLLK